MKSAIAVCIALLAFTSSAMAFQPGMYHPQSARFWAAEDIQKSLSDSLNTALSPAARSSASAYARTFQPVPAGAFIVMNASSAHFVVATEFDFAVWAPIPQKPLPPSVKGPAAPAVYRSFADAAANPFRSPAAQAAAGPLAPVPVYTNVRASSDMKVVPIFDITSLTWGNGRPAPRVPSPSDPQFVTAGFYWNPESLEAGRLGLADPAGKPLPFRTGSPNPTTSSVILQLGAPAPPGATLALKYKVPKPGGFDYYDTGFSVNVPSKGLAQLRKVSEQQAL